MAKAGRTKKVLIEKSAAKLFREKGFRGTSMRDIAKSVGLEAASLYNHIDSKQHILSELLMKLAHLFTEQMEEVNALNLSPIDKLKKLISVHVKMTIEFPDSISIITREWIYLEGPAFEQYKQMRSKYEEDFKRIIEGCIAEELFEPVNPEIALFSIMSTLRWLYSWYADHKHFTAKELEFQMNHCLIDGLRKRDD